MKSELDQKFYQIEEVLKNDKMLDVYLSKKIS